MYYLIYKTTCTINGKFYIGKHQTDDLEDGYLGSGKLLKCAIQKYGRENFKREILQFCSSKEEMNEAERNHVILCEDSYNLCPGGQGGWGYINANITSEKRTYLGKIGGLSNLSSSDRKKFGKLGGLSRREKLIEFNKSRIGKSWHKHTQEAKEKISEQASLRTGEKNSQFGSKWMTNGKENKKVKKQEIDFFISLGYTFGYDQSLINRK